VRDGSGDPRDLADHVMRQRRQNSRPIDGQHVVVDWGDGRGQADLELHAVGDDAGLLQALEDAPGLDRHVGIAGLEARRIGRQPALEAQARDLADQLAVPLHEAERRHVARDLDAGVVGQHVLEKADPGAADAGLAVGDADQMRPDRRGQRAKHGLGIGQRDAADEVDDRPAAAVRAHGLPSATNLGDGG
jgi:hypothetical protein